MDAATMTHGLLEWVRYEQWLVAVYPVLALHKINNAFVIQIELMSLESFVFGVHMRVTLYRSVGCYAISDCSTACPCAHMQVATFHLSKPHSTSEELSDGTAIAECLSQMCVGESHNIALTYGPLLTWQMAPTQFHVCRYIRTHLLSVVHSAYSWLPIVFLALNKAGSALQCITVSPSQ